MNWRLANALSNASLSPIRLVRRWRIRPVMPDLHHLAAGKGNYSFLTFQPPLVLDSNGGNAAKNFPVALRIYSSTADKSELYRLRYRAYCDAGWIAVNAQGEFADRFDRLASTFSIGAFHNGDCIGSLRLAFGGAGPTPHSMPCEEEFPDEIRVLTTPERNQLIEFSRMAVEPSLTNNSFRTTLYASLVRAAFILSYAAQVDFALIAVHKRVSPFYQAMCGFKVLGKSESYAGIGQPTHLLGREFRALDNRRQRRSAFFTVSDEEIDRARETLTAARYQAAA
jgi:N-acyl-L-homoserine lactone synthetase